MPICPGELSSELMVPDSEVRDSSISGPSETGLLALLACPCCRSDRALIAEVEPTLRCPDCNTRFPLVSSAPASIPWMFRQPDVARLEWSARYKGFMHQSVNEYNRLNRALKKTLSSQVARQRIESAMDARREHRNQVAAVLSSLELDGDVLVPAVTKTLHDKLPKNQALTSYADNVFRDWAWNNGENEALADAVAEVLNADQRDTLGDVLTLGAGACRLPYDLHRKYSPSRSVVLDINPLLLLLGCQVIHGESVPLYEFPLAALDDAISGVLQSCQAPAALGDDDAERFDFVLGDATNPPFAAQSFDTIVTPWLIDILPQDLQDFVPQVNRLLRDDGIWLNTGSLAFFHENPRRCYSEDEVLEIVEQNGFEIIAIDHRTIPYLQSPHSAHGRIERIVSFAARKTATVCCPSEPTRLPDWLLDVTRPVPGSAELVVESSSYLFVAQVTAAIDGKRSIQAIARMVAREYNLDLDQCVHAVSRILVDAYEGNTAHSLSWQY